MPALHVLIVDDDKICSTILERIITRLRIIGQETAFDITILQSAEEALCKLKTAKYDIIFTDIEMGALSGDEMVKTIRNELGYDTPIYAITAKHDIESRKRYTDAGITGCLAKPAAKNNIRNIIEEIIHSKNM